MQDILTQALQVVESASRKQTIRRFILSWDGGDMDTVLDISAQAMDEDRELYRILEDIETQFCECIHAEDGEADDEDEARVHAKTKVLLKQYVDEVQKGENA